MSQWQFKLFEFDIRTELPNIKNEYIMGKDTKQFVIQMYGIDENGITACLFVTGFNPFFYVKVDDWDNSKVIEFQNFIKKQLGSYYEDSVVKTQLIKKQKLYGFDNSRLYNFVKIQFKNLPAFNKAKNLWYDVNPKTFEKKLKPNGLVFQNTNTEIYEAQIPPLLRLFHIQNISPSGWIIIKDNFTENKNKVTSCDYEFIIDYKYINPINDIEKDKLCIPFKILSLDIEASSSHGDFPLARKNYLKLATNIVDYIIKKNIEVVDNDLLINLIKSGFDFKNTEEIDKVYIKKTTFCEEECEEKINLLLNLKPGTKENYIEFKESDDEDDEENVSNEFVLVEDGPIHKKAKISSHKNKDSTIIEILNDKTTLRNTKIVELTKCFGQHNPKNNNWEGIFPEVKGDEVTFIGSSLRRNGETQPYLRHCIVVNSCNDVENAVVQECNSEKEALLLWTKFIQDENPDIIIGYNIHGWDQGFMFDRSIELKCMHEFCKLSRYKNELCIKEVYQGPSKPKRITIEESNIKIASGQFDLRYFHMSGRLQIDFLNLFRREEQLPSYKLDYVSGHFIGDTIKEIEYDNNKSILYSKNLTGLNVNDYIIIEEIGHSTDVYEGGKKFKVQNIIGDKIILSEKINPDKNKILRWCLGKDDVSPQDIFRLTNEGPEGRAIVLKYCLKDCDLVQDLMRKNDTLTSYTEMSNLSWVPQSFLVFRGQGIKLTSYVAQKCMEKNTLMPVIDKGEMDEGYEGAIVLDPKCNLYLKKPVACVDYSSLYPSSIISENISHDSKVWTKEYDLEDNLIKETGEKDDNNEYLYDNLEGYKYIDITYDTFRWVRKTPKAAATKEKSGYKTCRFVQFNEGKAIMPSILQELLAARKATKKQMKNETDPFMANVYDKRQLAIKITANSLYGQCGAKTSTFYDKDIAASTTATGRKLLIYAKSIVESCYNDTIETTKEDGDVKCYGEYIYGDSVACYTPTYVRYNKNIIDICTIEELAKKYGNGWYTKSSTNKLELAKEYCELNNIESWTENGWTVCHRVIRHKLASHKNMVRILTHTGLVDVTDDHSLVKNTGEEISPKDVSIGTKLLHCTMMNTNWNKESDISIDEAKIMGFFFGDGSCGIYNCPSGKKASWALNNSSNKLIEKYYELCKYIYPEFEWKVYNTLKSSGVYKISFKVTDYGDKIKFIKNYRHLLYKDKSKVIPSEIINGTNEIREAFWEGLYDADGDKDKNGYTRIDQKSQISAAHICWLANSIGYNTSLNIRKDKINIYRITATKNKQRLDPDKIKKIVNMENTQDYVYDLTTENHHFAAGIGNMIVHNTDSVFFTFNLKDLNGIEIIGEKALKITIELAQKVGELATTMLKDPHDLEYEKTFYPFCLLSKKRYVGILYEFDTKKGKRKSMGIVLKRRDNAPIVKDIYGGLIDILMKEKVIYKAVDFVKECLQNVVDEKYAHQKLIITKSLRSYYKNPMQIAHNVLASRIGDRDPGNKPKPGDRIPFIYIKNNDKKALQGEKIETPSYALENKLEIDYGFYITNQIMKPIQQVFALVLEEMADFKDKHGMTQRGWKEDIKKLKEKWPDHDKFQKKYEELRCKEVKKLLFDNYIKQVK
tara:strand:+ start:206 stop:5005 length:4800 start_codon:yes stop_codon:yes gene_type:complete